MTALLAPIRLLWVLLYFAAATGARSVTIFGATSGIGQLVASKALLRGFQVNAVTRSVSNARQFENLMGCALLEADCRFPATIPDNCLSSEQVVICIGTTAFPTKRWEDGANSPKIACLDSVVNVLDRIDSLPFWSKKPRRVTLISSIGVDRQKSFPFLILNRYGVLDFKRQSEVVLRERGAKAGYETLVIRPGRLVGPPFTNTDLAKLLKLDQGDKRSILLDRNDVLAGDTERADVSQAVVRFFDFPSLQRKSVTFSLVNTRGEPPSEVQWKALLTEIQEEKM